MTKNSLLKIARIQEIDLTLTNYGISRKTIYDRIIYPTWFVDRKTYYNWLDVNAKKELREMYDADWEQELARHIPIDYIRLMKQIKDKNFFDLDGDERLSAEERAEIIKDLKK